MKSRGKIEFELGANVWPHELKTAESLAKAGYSVLFVKKSDVSGEKTADLIIDGEFWEMKSPNSGTAKAIDHNLRKAVKQSCNVIFDSQRIKGIPDKAIEHELLAESSRITAMKKLFFVDKHRNIIQIKP